MWVLRSRQKDPSHRAERGVKYIRIVRQLRDRIGERLLSVRPLVAHNLSPSPSLRLAAMARSLAVEDA